ncbi:hypothetical protein AX769_20515 [Frondihabitans sp. PAMC 28766]|uniref:twin-arginine translocase TatA/TatE family subunit n=1 Tax=Frondihabitans sp. PAMC 28766 TaxID=1795630 RepID=UPI00078CE557|nr:twin-arginine translocase TatA/TatE family subunit [Frondihabitans sp. PAMC 28766]AMM22092.1 hypothetical protein AX769_20515 [Frondihabitans sp. PAMC 28766]
MLRDLGGWHLLIILGIVVLLFGSTKLPALTRGVAQSMRIFKSEMKEPSKTATATAAPGTAAPAAPSAPFAQNVAEPVVTPVTTPPAPPQA